MLARCSQSLVRLYLGLKSHIQKDLSHDAIGTAALRGMYRSLIVRTPGSDSEVYPQPPLADEHVRVQIEISGALISTIRDTE